MTEKSNQYNTEVIKYVLLSKALNFLRALQINIKSLYQPVILKCVSSPFLQIRIKRTSF